MRRRLLVLGLWAAPSWAIDYKEGFERALPLLQTRVRPALAPDHLYWGMLLSEFTQYAEVNQWPALEAPRPLNQVLALSFVPEGNGLYTPEDDLVFIQDVQINVYFRRGRLIGLLLFPKQSLTPQVLRQWVRAWFPDNAVRVQYQKQYPNVIAWQDAPISQALLGEIPAEFERDLKRSLNPFRVQIIERRKP